MTQDESARWHLEGSANPKVVAAGHSHILALLGALHSSQELQNQQLGVFYSLNRNIWPNINDEYWDHLSCLQEVETIAICWNGNQHNALFLLESQPPIAVYHPSLNLETQLTPVVPLTMFDEIWRDDFQQLEKVVRSLQGKKRVVLLGTPPPKSVTEIRRNLNTDEYFLGLLKQSGLTLENAPITSDEFRFVLWRRIQKNLERIARLNRVAFVHAPPQTMENNMTLSHQYSAPDASHANHVYGQAMWRTLLQKVSSQA